MPLGSTGWTWLAFTDGLSYNKKRKRQVGMNLGMMELLVVLAIVVLFFGGRKLPQLGSALGESIKNFKKGMKEDDTDKKA